MADVCEGLRSAPPDPAKPSAFFYGVIPINPANRDAPDAGLGDLFSAVGAPGAVLEVRAVAGDDGSVLARGSYPVDQPPTRAQAAVGDLLNQALALAKTPTQCSKVQG